MSAEPRDTSKVTDTAEVRASDDTTAGVRTSAESSASPSADDLRTLLHRTMDDVLSIAEQVLGGGARGVGGPLLDRANDVAGLARSVLGGSAPSIREMSGLVSGVAGHARGTTSPPLRTAASGGLSLSVSANGTASGQVDVSNDGSTPLDDLEFVCPGLTRADGAGEVLAATVALTPERLHVCPGLSSKVTVTVTVPENATSGTYLGWLAVRGRPSIHLPLTVTVQ
ncbi:MAG: hypothetical protein QOJ32_2465 [Frankiaceae bacterium]|nr:hypothetical protein [Frankiaceae bacterium]